MELSDFITSSIAEVVKGLENAKSPDYVFGLLKDKGIEFDVAVKEKRTRKKSGKAGAGVGIIALQGHSAKDSSDENVNRLRFTVYAQAKKGKKK